MRSLRRARVSLPWSLWRLAGCRLDMHIQPKYLPYEPTDFFADGRSERQPVAGTVARGQLRLDELFYTGKENGVEADEFPFPITQGGPGARPGALQHLLHALPRLRRELVRFYRAARLSACPLPITFNGCAKRPPAISYGVITNGLGAMYSYADRIDPADRWRIVAYIRVLQASRNAHLSDVPRSRAAEIDCSNEPGRATYSAAIGATATAMTLIGHSSANTRPLAAERAGLRRDRRGSRAGDLACATAQQFFRSYLFAFVYWICDPAWLHRRPDAASPDGRLVGTSDPAHSRSGLANDSVDGRAVYSGALWDVQTLHLGKRGDRAGRPGASGQALVAESHGFRRFATSSILRSGCCWSAC